MNVSRDSMLALQRHFLGALSAPARTWLEPLPSPPLAFAGDAIRAGREGCMLDFGSVVSPGEEHRLVRVFHCGSDRLDVRLAEVPPWLTARWLDADGDAVALTGGDAGATLELRAIHDTENALGGSLRFLAGDRVEELPVQLVARRAHPIAQIDFNGSPSPRPFEFDTAGRAYALTIANATLVPLIVTFADLPDWLTFEVDTRHRNGPIAGTFFERAAPFRIALRPRLDGPREGSLRMQTNDPRPQWQDVELKFASSPAVILSRRSAAKNPPIPEAPPRARRKATLTPDTIAALLALLVLTLLFVVVRGLQ